MAIADANQNLVLSLRNFIQEEGIPSPLAPSLLVAFYNTQRIRWHYSFVMPDTTGVVNSFVGLYNCKKHTFLKFHNCYTCK